MVLLLLAPQMALKPRYLLDICTEISDLTEPFLSLSYVQCHYLWEGSNHYPTISHVAWDTRQQNEGAPTAHQNHGILTDHM
jgi:hypothetical protein